MNRDSIDSVLRSLRRVNLQGSLFGHTVALRFGLSESDLDNTPALPLNNHAAEAVVIYDLQRKDKGQGPEVGDQSGE